MRVLAINSMYANRLYRRCADELGAIDGVDLSILTVESWVMNGRPMPMEPVDPHAPYRTFIGKTGWSGRENRGFYTEGLKRAFTSTRPEVIFLMEEPFSVFALQVLQMNRLTGTNAPIVFFTWNNLSLSEYDYRPSIFYRNVAKWTLPRMQYALTANTAGIDVLRDFGFDGPATLAGYGVDTARYQSVDASTLAALRNKHAISDDQHVIGYVGRLLHMKGLDLLIDSFANLSRSRKDLRLLLVGSGPDEAMFMRQAHERGVRDAIIHVPSVPHDEVPLYMHLLDTLVLPSRRVGMWAEQFGRVAVEAMAAGKVVLGSSSGAIPEVIGDAGFVFEENNATDLKSKLASILALSANERQAYAERGRSRATNVYNWRRFAETAHSAICSVGGGAR